MGCFSASARFIISTIGQTRWRRLTRSAFGLAPPARNGVDLFGVPPEF